MLFAPKETFVDHYLDNWKAIIEKMEAGMKDEDEWEQAVGWRDIFRKCKREMEEQCFLIG